MGEGGTGKGGVAVLAVGAVHAHAAAWPELTPPL